MKYFNPSENYFDVLYVVAVKWSFPPYIANYHDMLVSGQPIRTSAILRTAL